MKLISLPLLALLGCASIPPEQQAQQLSTYSLCYFAVGGNPQQQSVAGQEVRRRGVSCSPQMVDLGAQEVAQRRAAQEAGYAQMGAWGAAILSQPPNGPGMNCWSETVGNQTFTRCR